MREQLYVSHQRLTLFPPPKHKCGTIHETLDKVGFVFGFY